MPWLRRILVPLAVVVIAAALGTFVIGRARVTASSTAMQNPGLRLTAASRLTSRGLIAAGRTLYTQTCSTCHGGDAQGSALGTDLQGLGGAAVDLWLTTGWMPLRTPGLQPANKPVNLTTAQINEIVAYVVSIKPGGVPVPTNISLKGASASEGFYMFSLNCAPCHTITGAGDALAEGFRAPSLHSVTPTQVLEAIRTGPSNMPRFGPGDISPKEALDVALYVTKYIKHPADIGGIGLGGVGPVAEGFVGLFVGVGVCLLAAYWVGDRTARGDGEAHGEGGEDESDHEGDAPAAGVDDRSYSETTSDTADA
ncbi:MAG: c-type cytochrome [Actinomycetota bacterium]|nr:c-type cytochrome [Actinomycetota bacterium]